jgi:chaperonin GroES
MPKIIRPLRDNILVKQDPPKEKLNGLFLPQGSRDLYEDVGTVIATGPGTTVEGGVIIPVSVKPGDRVAFKRRPASSLGDIDPDWENMLMLKDEDIIGVLNDE